MQVVLSEKAELDLVRIYRYLEERSPKAAEAFIRRVHSNFENLVRFPYIGRERSALAPGLRCLVTGPYLVFYTVGPQEITVVRVIDSRMDVDEEFRR
ncbi:MAG: type II toxin-antitoxin system RelE/ParE family toxin [Pseudomonadota bacterium]